MFIVLKNATDKWIIYKDSERHAEICEIKGHFGEWVCDILPAYHSMYTCDTSYPSNRAKVRLLNNMIKKKKGTFRNVLKF